MSKALLDCSEEFCWGGYITFVSTQTALFGGVPGYRSYVCFGDCTGKVHVGPLKALGQGVEPFNNATAQRNHNRRSRINSHLTLSTDNNDNGHPLPTVALSSPKQTQSVIPFETWSLDSHTSTHMFHLV